MGRELQELSHRHMAMVDAALGGASNGDIARIFGMTDSTVSLILRAPLFQDELARRRASQQQTVDNALASTVSQSKLVLEAAAEKAANVHVHLLDSVDPKVRQLSATEILKRTHDNKFMLGQNGQPVVSINLGPESLLNLQIALRESRELDLQQTLPREVEPQLVEPADTPLAATSK